MHRTDVEASSFIDVARPVIGVTYSSEELDGFLLWRQMFRGIVEAGGVPLALDCRHPQPAIADLVARLDGLVVSGGGDIDPRLYGGDAGDPSLRGINTARDQAELSALEVASKHRRPVLAICRGAQLLNVARGGSLFMDLARDHRAEISHRATEEVLDQPQHTVEVWPETRLAEWTGGGRISVNSQHHQGIRDLAPDLLTTAVAPDGLIEAFETADRSMVAVQWHPEVLWPNEPHALNLLRGFVVSCSGHPATTGANGHAQV